MIIGHKKQKENIEKIFDLYGNGGFLLYGPEGVGKFSLLKELTENKEVENDVIIVEAPKKSISKNTSEVLRNLALFNSSKNRIIIINDAHFLTSEAQNVLLKILEEIPSKTFFFFITHRPHKILATIRSRLQPVKFGFVEDDEIKKLLKEQGSDKDSKVVCEAFSGQTGLIIKAISEKIKFNLVSKFIKEQSSLQKMFLSDKITENMELDEFLKYLIVFERINLRENSKEALLRIKNLLALYFDNEYAAPPLSKNLHIKNICVNYY